MTGCMALFFLLVGLEIKRELLVGRAVVGAARRPAGHRRARRHGGTGGGLLPCSIATRRSRCAAGRSPAATDIAFSLGVLSLLGARVPVSLKVFLTALAILDDLGAIVIIALFYSADLSLARARAGGRAA